MLDDKGNKVGVPIKASALHCTPTLKNLQALFQRGTSLKQNENERLTTVIDSFFRITRGHSQTQFCNYLKSNGINAMFRESRDGRVYGLTFVDHKSGAVFNGSDLGKQYSGQALAKRLESISVVQTEGHQRYIRIRQLSTIKKSGHPITINPSQESSSAVLSLINPEKAGQGPVNPELKRKQTRKRKKGLSM